MKRIDILLVAVGALSLAALAMPATAAVDTTPPVWTKLPTSAMPIGAALDPAGSWDDSCTYIDMRVMASYRASDPESGIAYYSVSQDVAGPDGGPDLGLATQTPVYAWVEDDVCGGGGDDQVFYAFNNAGLYAEKSWTSSRLSVLQDDGDWWPASVGEPQGIDAPPLTYKGAWSTSACNCWADGTTQKTSQSAASVTFTIPEGYGGTHGVGVVMAKGPDRGKAAIYVDNVKVATIDTYRATKLNRTVVWRQALTTGSHTVKVVNLATPGRPRIDIDAFVLLRK